ACNMDVEMVSSRCQDMKSRVDLVEAKLRMRLAVLEKERATLAAFANVKNDLSSFETELATSSFKQLSDKLTAYLRSKIDKCREMDKSSSELVKLEEMYAKLES